jgi:predicted metalloprotease
MRWRGERQSTNIEDRRGRPGSGGMGGMRIPGGTRRGGGIGLGTIVIGLIIAWLFGINPLSLLGVVDMAAPGGQVTSQQAGPSGAPIQDEMGQFVSVVLASTEDTWNAVFAKAGARYQPPKLVLYSGSTRTACGMGSAAAGPFYCPADQTVYIDLSFYQTLRQRFGASGDLAEAYVIAHEVGHHVQNLVGTMAKMDAARRQMSERDYNQLSIRLELQADCFAGIWTNHSQQAKGWLEAGDIEEAIQAAAAVGDDNIMKRTQGTVVPDAFTHGSSEQRVRWFRIGAQTGQIEQCNTFAASRL